ncbi:TRAP transporter large permease [Salipiger marinus]|jgi:C4-dicarboxylate transporter DctM subunit|uniref:TRAP transporter large permease protein n=1 Tax=Salipiger marinus TaxID=555512 RepID=A0A1G8KA73_9RHOB|nr:MULTISPECIES: TRAP transporter large permease [Salipiger]MCD1618660.1 TRAP transporter large permease [Salipiger manganoxidans]MEB3417612.1 TRAP transporter large permease [Salipiger manganoxidans]SDI40267.1 C4-dicarboxylate transporter, DctM subunit [Salipiger marinus]HBT02212.1 TRAP transporter large permease [Citreicella sp.]
MQTVAILTALFACLFAGVPVGLALTLMGAALYLFKGIPLAGIPEEFLGSFNSFILLAVPIFLLTSNILLRAGVARDLFDAVQRWVGGIRGGVAVSTILSCAIFAAISGSSVAVAAMIGTVAIPEMTRRGYNQRFVMGTLAAGATLGILIPPSIPLIVYAAVTEQSTAAMFLAGVGPGIVLVGAFLVYCVIKSFMGGAPVHEDSAAELGSRWRVSLKALPTVAIALTMIGGIYAGIFTPTESAAVGLAMTVIYVMFLRRSLDMRGLRGAVVQSGTTTANLLLIVGGANVFGKAILLYRIPFDISTWIAANITSAGMFILVVMLLLIVLGLFLEGIAMILIVLPVLLPSLGVHGIDPIWFGIFFVLMIELALISPPVGMNLFVIQSVARADLKEVILGVVPYALIMLAMVGVLYAFPAIVLWLPFAS